MDNSETYIFAYYKNLFAPPPNPQNQIASQW
jgi:hypothetical protein